MINLENPRGFIKNCSSLENAGKDAIHACLKENYPMTVSKHLAPNLRIFKC